MTEMRIDFLDYKLVYQVDSEPLSYRDAVGGNMRRMTLFWGLLLLAGCGVDWFPSNNGNTFTNTSTAKRTLAASPALQNLSAAQREGMVPGDYSTARRAENDAGNVPPVEVRP